MTLALSIVALCISVAAFTLSVIKHFQGERSSKYLQHRNSLVLAKSILQEAIALRERARGVEHDILDDSFEVIEKLTEQIGDMAGRISRFDPSKLRLDVLHQLENKIHSLAIEVALWQSMVEGVAGFWGDENNPNIEQVVPPNGP
jgi:hypothetical protein